MAEVLANARTNPLTPAERDIITRAASTGIGVMLIRRVLAQAGFRRGPNIILDFLAESGIQRPHNQPTTYVHHHECVFCSWRGLPHEYYSHWRLHHRTRVGLTRREVEDHRHA